MKPGTTKLYHAREFAELAGVTVRTLHYYDRLGLLQPSYRSDAQYRLYSQRDLAQLEQIVVLKFLGLPLKSIGRFPVRAGQAGGGARAPGQGAGRQAPGTRPHDPGHPCSPGHAGQEPRGRLDAHHPDHQESRHAEPNKLDCQIL